MLETVQNAVPHPLHPNFSQYSQTMAQSRGAGEKEAQDCWKLMTRAERLLLFLLIISLLVVVTLSVFIIAFFLAEKPCDTPICIQASSKLLEAVDFEADPCVDFHEFLCGRYIPTCKNYKDEGALRKAELVSDPASDGDTPILAMVKKFYQACTNTSAIEDDNEASLFSLISDLGGWPLLMGKEWNETGFNWQRFMTQVRPLGIKSDWLISLDYFDEDDTNLLLIRPPRLTSIPYRLKRDYYLEVIIYLADKMGTSSFSQPQLTQMIDFEERVHQIIDNSQHFLLQKGDYTKWTVETLMNEIWPENLLRKILNGLALGHAIFDNSTTVVVASENYLYELHKLLMGTSKRTQANYFMWKIVETFLPFSSDEIREIYGKYSEISDREDHCQEETNRRFHSAIEAEYVAKYKNNDVVVLLESITNLVFKSYNETDDVETNLVIEGPEGDHSGVTNIQYSSDKIIRMISDVQFHVENEFYKCLHKRTGDCSRENYYDESQDFEPHFDASENTFYLPYNLIYSDSFTWDQPNYINFARIGRTIADKIIEAQEDFNSTSKTGVELAYDAYLSWIQNKGMDKRLPALNYSVNQLFWIHSSSLQCSSEDDSSGFDEVTDSQYFKEDFNCQ